MDWSLGRSTFDEAMRRQASWMRRSIRVHEIGTDFYIFIALANMLAIFGKRED